MKGLPFVQKDGRRAQSRALVAIEESLELAI
jgi:hypothetical protein